MIPDKRDDFIGKCPISHQIPEAIDEIRLLVFQIIPNCLQRMDIGMDIREHSNLHDLIPAFLTSIDYPNRPVT
jgi:hypothetical protein